MFRVAIVGCGRMGRERARCVSQLGGRIVTACDADQERSQSLAAQHQGCSAVAEPAHLPWSDLDAVFVCTPPAARGPVELTAIQAGVALFVEKPIGLSAAHVEAILHALLNKPVVTAVGYMNRYRSSVQWVRDRLTQVRILGLSGNWVCGMYQVPWWARNDQSGGPINEQCTHLVDLCRFLAGEITQVQAMASSMEDNNGLNSTAGILLRFAGGHMATLFYSCLARTKQIGLTAFTPERPFSLTGWNLEVPAESADPPPVDTVPVFEKEVEAFMRSVQQQRPDLVRSTFPDAFRTQRVMDAIQQAILGGSAEMVP